ncbi:S15/NS1 RNA-binding domain-containing protein [Pisolithus thermaeus]|nr:S15/NS1 RNA-binding domain-containing protein [Pisolithus thermaeus]
MYRILVGQGEAGLLPGEYDLSLSLATQPSVVSTARVQLHTSAVCLAQRKKVKESKSAVRDERKRAKDAARLYAVLGIPRGGQDKWPQCDLARAVITQDRLHSEDAHESLAFPEGVVNVPSTLNYGISGDRKKMLFEVLPVLSAERGRVLFNADTVRETEEAMKHEVEKANMFAKLVSLRNANAKGIAYENRRRCIELFSTPEIANDTGRPEVQAAILTLKIRNLWEHLLKFRMDIDNRRALRRMVHQRAKVLKYLKRKDLDRYEAILPRLGLEPGSVEGELVV